MSGELINLLCIIHRDGGQYLQQHGLEKAYADAVDILHRWKFLPEQLTEAQKQIVMLRSVVAHIQRCIPFGGFAQIHYGSATAADMDAALTATQDLSGLVLCEAEPVGEVQHMHELNDEWLGRLPIGIPLYQARKAK